ncbi:sensor histidine kinase [Streptomyces buecherae]|uniref:sensor histidine kinase n=1 Tax=Streptomyces buecherae TaxID=2763006 RepID=UPI0020B707C6|nr:histidine kinase [Streptomyces buecherae]
MNGTLNGTHEPPPAPVASGAPEGEPAQAPGARPARARRGPRDWAVDLSAFVLAALFSFMTAESVVEDPDLPELWLFVDQVLGMLACAALWFRRRWPVPLAAAMLLASTASHFVIGPSLVVMFTVAVHRPFRPVAVVGALAFASSLVNGLVHTDPDLGYVGSVLTGALLYSTAIGWGMFVRSRRQLVISLRERAHRAESEAALRAERVQRLTRERIAREMHDVLAHRLSLLSVHAGALEYRPDAPPQDVAQAAGVIRASAHQALEDLREVIGVLRAPIGQPTAGAGTPTAAVGAPSSTAGAGTGAGADTASEPRPGAAARRRPSGFRRPRRERAADRADRAAGAACAPHDQQAPPAARDLWDGAEPSRPQPTLADLPRLVDESRQAAMRVALHDEREACDPVPAATGRTAYRIVQEGLTNARKHAPDAAVTVRVAGAPERGLTVEVRDRPVARAGRARRAERIPGSGQGLIGLAERASLAGGGLESRAVEDGGFLLRAWLPWPS